MAFAHVYLNIKAILILDVALNVYKAQTAPKTKHVFEVNVLIHVRELAE